jgi:hypothetical protein
MGRTEKTATTEKRCRCSFWRRGSGCRPVPNPAHFSHHPRNGLDVQVTPACLILMTWKRPVTACYAFSPFAKVDGTGRDRSASPPAGKTNATTAARSTALAGPGGARVLIKNVFSVLMPNNPIVRTSNGRILVALPSTPVNALAVLGPQVSRMSAMQGGPQMTFDNIVQRDRSLIALAALRSEVAYRSGGPAVHAGA